MGPAEVLAVAALGLAGGVVGGLLGVGGGILFVPALAIFGGLNQVEAASTSLLAIVAVAGLGAHRQHGYGNLRIADGLLIGALSLVGVVAGALIANSISPRALEVAFAILLIVIAAQLAFRALRPADG